MYYVSSLFYLCITLVVRPTYVYVYCSATSQVVISHEAIICTVFIADYVDHAAFS